MAENVYLYCASEGLGTVIRALFDGPALEKAMKLRSDQKVILCQTVGYPKNNQIIKKWCRGDDRPVCYLII